MIARIILLLLVLPFFVSAQLANTGEKLFIQNGGVVYVGGDLVHLGGIDLVNGKLVVQADIKNKDISSKIFDARSTGTVTLAGAAQRISGSAVLLPSLELKGSSIKYLETTAEITNELDLTDREFVINTNNLSILSANANAVKRTLGYVNTDLGGKLIRNTLVNVKYLYPLGSSAANRYRPVEIEAKDANGRFAATLFNSDPNLKGYNRNNKRPDIKNVYDKYWFSVSQLAGGTRTDLSFFINSTDNVGKQLVEWGAANLWEKAAPSTITNGTFGDGLNTSYLMSKTTRFADLPITFAETESENPLTFFNGFSPDGDGKNDTWMIKNIDLFPDNDITIINRWGDEVYRTKGYSTTNVWDGANLNAGTYYYVLNVNINGKRQSFKGFITLVKK